MNRRDEQEIITKTLIVTGLKDEEAQSAIRAKIEGMYETRETYVIQNNTSLVFINFYDERTAVKARSYLEENEGLLAYHTISKYEIPRDADRCDGQKGQSTLLFVFRNLVSPVGDAKFLEELKRFGEVKCMKYAKNFQKCVEFYDSRSAEKAHNNMNDTAYAEGQVQARWNWDLPMKARWDLIKLTDSILKECKVDIGRGTKRTGEETEDGTKRIKATEIKSTSRNMFLQRFDEFIAANIDFIESNTAR
jgi:hypothetical protein